jgi:glycerol-3-phosphate acyltransferase PlsX
MNIGSEEAKGTDLIKETRDLLRATPGINYIGYIEGREFFEGAADVVVTDGLVGNTLLKAAEGMAKAMFKAIAGHLIEHDIELALKFEGVIKGLYKKHDYHEHGGAPLLGVNGGCFIAHGSSEARTIRAAIRNCRAFVAAGINAKIVARLEEVERHAALAQAQTDRQATLPAPHGG